MLEHIDILKRLCKTAKQQDENFSWDEEDMDKLIVVYLESFKISEKLIVKFICDLKPFRTSLLAALLEKDILQITTIWNVIIKQSKKESTFLEILEDAFENSIPILENELKSAEILKLVIAFKSTQKIK